MEADLTKIRKSLYHYTLLGTLNIIRLIEKMFQ